VRARRLLKEPLLHFLLIGFALFIVYAKLASPDRSGTTIVVSEAMVDELAREHEVRWARKASDQELAGLVDGYVRDEVLYREGLTLGLDRDDALIKRRIRQKFEVIAEEQNASATPSDADLASYVTAHPARFLLPARVSFEQVFFGDALDVERAVANASVALARGADPSSLGRGSMLPSHLDNAARDLIARDFGTAFAGRIETAPLGRWSGPIGSSFGTHLVRVTARTPAALPDLDSVRQIARREWETERRMNARHESYAKVRGNYTVVIEAKKLASLPTQR